MRSFENDPRTMLGADALGWSWPSSVAEAATTLLAQGVLTFFMPKGESISLPMPWDKPTADQAPVAPEVVEEMVARLAKYSAFAD